MFNKNFFLEAKISVSLIIPLVFSYLVQSSSAFISNIMIAHLGRDAMAAMALGSSLFMMILMMNSGIFNSLSVLISKNYARGKISSINRLVSQGLFLATILGVISVAILWVSPYLFIIDHQDKDLVVLASQYMHSILWVVPLWSFVGVFEFFLISIERPRLVLITSALTIPFEIFAAYLLIFGKLGCPRLGIAGLGYGLTIVNIFAVFGFILIFKFSKNYKKYSLFKVTFTKLDFLYLKKMLKIGVPIAIMFISELFAIACFALMMGHTSHEELAAYQVTQQYLSVVLVVVYAISQTLTVRVGSANFHKDKIKNAILFSSLFCLIVSLIIAFFGIITAKYMVAIDFSPTLNQTKLTYYGILFLVLINIVYPFEGLRTVIFGALRGLGDTFWPMVLTVITFSFSLLLGYFLLNASFSHYLGGINILIGLFFASSAGMIMLFWRLLYFLKKLPNA